MSDLDALFAPVPQRAPSMPTVIEKEIETKSLYEMLRGDARVWIAIGVVFLGILFAMFWASRKTEDAPDMSVVDKVRAAAAQADGLPFAQAPEAPRLHPNAVINRVDPSDPSSLRELGSWLRDGLQARGVAPALTTQLVTLAIRGNMAEEQKRVPEVKREHVQESRSRGKPIVLDVRGLPIPVEEEQEVKQEKQGRINAETDPRLLALAKARETKEEK